MKTKKTILILSALAVALCLGSCDKNEEAIVDNGEVRFTAGIGKEAVATPQSRASGTEWGPGDDIGIFMVTHGNTDIAESAENKKYTTATGNGNFAAVLGHEIYYPMDNAKVDFIAYYPHKEGAALGIPLDVVIATNQTSDTQADTDLMWAKADNSGPGYAKDAAIPVALDFSHRLSKLTMNCKLDVSMGSATLDGATVTIHGMNTKQTFNLATGTLTGTPGTPVSITPRKLSNAPAGCAAAYDAIILPGEYFLGALSVDFTIGAETFTWYINNITFDPGNEYIYEVTIKRTGVSATGTISPWTKNFKDPVTAE